MAKDFYQVLGIEKGASEDEIKKAYRKLMSEHHPDKLVSKGLPKQAIEIAKNKAHRIINFVGNSSYYLP